MVEPLSIATAITGFIGFVVLVKNLISTILNDADAVRNDTDGLVAAEIRLIILSSRMENWKEFWRIRDGMPLELYDSYWSPDGRQKILQLLNLLHGKGADLHREFESEYRKGGDRRTGRVDQRSAEASAYDEQQEMERLQAFQSMYRSKVNLIRRVGRALYKWPRFGKSLELSEKWLDLLLDASTEFFKVNNSLDDESEWKERVDIVSTSFILTRVADRYSHASSILGATLLGIESHAIDLYLDHRTDPARRMEILSLAAQENSNSFQYNFCLLSVLGSDDIPIDFSCKIPSENQEAVPTIGRQQHQSFDAVICDLTRPPNRGHNMSFWFQARQGVPAFVLERLEGRSGVGDDLQIQCLRTFMAIHKVNYEEELHGPFKSEERWRLAYELAEWALLFLKTNWFSKLCSCCVYRTETADLRTTFRARFGKVPHIDVDIGDVGNTRQWCEEEIRNMHIRRLGVLLVEIALGFPVPDVVLHPVKGIMIDEELDVENPERTKVLDRRAINRKIRREMGQDYTDAMDYCLQQGITPDRVRMEELQSFQSHVVEPLYSHYRQLSIHGPARRQARRAARGRHGTIA
ncbi:hypothetical protein CLAIMM_14635 [Cladophialophora immunda]|nr:hypothetical protein CLAIMM_14635 [Cladophialophora immunda]